MSRHAQVSDFRIQIRDTVLSDLNHRLWMTRFPDHFDGMQWEMGVDVPYLENLVDYWRTEFVWRGFEETLNQFPQYLTEIDGQSIHFLHVRSVDPEALPLLLLHGWPGSVIEFLGVIDTLVDPPRDAGQGQSFHLVIPSLPGFGFSGPTREPGWNIQRTAAAFSQLMSRLGYDRYGVQGGDWGSMIATRMACIDEEHVVGLHTNLPLARAPEEPGDLTPAEIARLEDAERYGIYESGYARLQGTKPQTIGLLLNDSPAGLLGWIVEKFRAWSDCNGDVESVFSRDDLIANVMIYWVTQTATSAARMYYENFLPAMAVPDGDTAVSVPTGVARFPKETMQMPRAWLERRYNIVHWTELDRGGHFAALEQPRLFAEDVARFFSALRQAR